MNLIDADVLKRMAQKAATEAWKMKITARVETILNQFIDWIEEAPTIDAVEVVRCKDCKFAKLTANDEVKYCDVWSPDDKVYMDAKTNFCSCGERKEERR